MSEVEVTCTVEVDLDGPVEEAIDNADISYQVETAVDEVDIEQSVRDVIDEFDLSEEMESVFLKVCEGKFLAKLHESIHKLELRIKKLEPEKAEALSA